MPSSAVRSCRRPSSSAAISSGEGARDRRPSLSIRFRRLSARFTSLPLSETRRTTYTLGSCAVNSLVACRISSGSVTSFTSYVATPPGDHAWSALCRCRRISLACSSASSPSCRCLARQSLSPAAPLIMAITASATAATPPMKDPTLPQWISRADAVLTTDALITARSSHVFARRSLSVQLKVGNAESDDPCHAADDCPDGLSLRPARLTSFVSRLNLSPPAVARLSCGNGHLISLTAVQNDVDCLGRLLGRGHGRIITHRRSNLARKTDECRTNLVQNAFDSRNVDIPVQSGDSYSLTLSLMRHKGHQFGRARWRHLYARLACALRIPHQCFDITNALGERNLFADQLPRELREIQHADLLASDLVAKGHKVNVQGCIDHSVFRDLGVVVTIAIQFTSCPVAKLGVPCLRAKSDAPAEGRSERHIVVQRSALDVRKQAVISSRHRVIVHGSINFRGPPSSAGFPVARPGCLRCVTGEPSSELPGAPRSRASSPGRRRRDAGRAGGPTRRRRL